MCLLITCFTLPNVCFPFISICVKWALLRLGGFSSSECLCLVCLVYWNSGGVSSVMKLCHPVVRKWATYFVIEKSMMQHTQYTVHVHLSPLVGNFMPYGFYVFIYLFIFFFEKTLKWHFPRCLLHVNIGEVTLGYLYIVKLLKVKTELYWTSCDVSIQCMMLGTILSLCYILWIGLFSFHCFT